MAFDHLPHAGFAPDNPPDLAQRRAALDPNRSFAVAAPAGSGKTGLLTQRVLTLLSHCDEPEEVLAITFTRKAAGEMQDRILQALWQASEQPEPTDNHTRLTWQLARKVLERDRECQWNLLLSPQRLRIQTIDSLCRAITRQLPLASGIGAQPDTLEAPDSAYRLAVRELLALLEQENPLREDLQRLLQHLDNNLQTVEALLVNLLARREQWLEVLLQARAQHAREYLETVLQQVIVEHLQQLTSCLQTVASDLCLIADRAAAHLREAPSGKALGEQIAGLCGIDGLPECTPESVSRWQALAGLLISPSSGEFRKRVDKNTGFPAGKEHADHKNRFCELVADLQENQPEALALLNGVLQLPPPRYNDAQWQLLDSLTRLLPVLVAQLTLVFKQQGATDYSAIAQAANLALGDEDNPSDIALQLDYRIRHILVDEFQDTASPQLQLLQKLTAGWQPGDGRTLFIVGDGMQSCYGFRNANVGLFLDARQNGIGSVPLESLDLTVNFRSQAGVVRWVNDTFLEAFPARDDISRGAVCYAPSTAFNPPLPEAAVSFYACTYQKPDEDNDYADGDASPLRTIAQLREAESVVGLVQQARAANPDGTVAILVRTRGHLEAILPALARAGLHWQATDIDSLASRMAIVDLMSLTRALLNLDDRIAWLSILRAPWCGLDLHDLYHLVNADLGALSPRPGKGDWPVIWQQLQYWRQIPELSFEGRECVQRLMAVLQPAWQSRQRKPLRQWIEGVWLALGGPATLLDPGDSDNIPSYFSLLEKHQQGGGIRDWQEFATAVERLFAAPRADADPRLHVMTLHKSKGLEFDTVVIPGLDRGARSDDKALLLWQERLDAQGERQLLLGPLAAVGEDQDALYTFMRLEADLQQRYEATRLLYVGCTRAIKRLHLLACLNLNGKTGTATAPGKKSLLASIWPQVQEQMLPPPAELPDIPEADEEFAIQQHILRLPVDWHAPALDDVTILQAYRGHEYDDEDNLPEVETLQARLARHTGTVIHNQLQHLTLQGTGVWSEEWARQRQPFWALQLRQLGWKGLELESALTKIRRALELTLKDPDGLWLLDNTHTDSQCELAIQHWHGDHLRESIVDRAFIAQGVRWIVDYKSSTPTAGQTLEAFFAQEQLAYRDQLLRYAEAVRALDGTEAKTALYFPLLEADQRLLIV